MNNYSNNKLHDPRCFKEEVRIKFNAVKAIAGKFLDGTAAIMALLVAAAPVIDWAGYCALTPAKQLMWEERGDGLNKTMLYLMNLKNKHAKKDLHLAYSQANLTAYPSPIKGMARYLLTQYPNNKPTNQRDDKKGIKRREMIWNTKERIVRQVALQVHTLKIPLHLKNQLFLVENIV